MYRFSSGVRDQTGLAAICLYLASFKYVSIIYTVCEPIKKDLFVLVLTSVLNVKLTY